ncbi:helix-turn-helix domain-containing protein [Dialister sp.]|uniref:helix-turn-helix domain-containing protein n=1 Tax=Dialister sp. TaxID=1955814 RepID=UPI00338EED2F
MNTLDKITYSAYEVSKLLGISTPSVYSLCRQGKIPCIKLGGRILIPRKQFSDWLDNEVK